MISTLVLISMQRLWNNKQELALLFVVPVLFFSIFAMIFSRGVGQSVSRVRLSVVDDDATEHSKAIIETALKRPEMVSVTQVGKSVTGWETDQLARYLLSRRGAEVVVVIPKGFTNQDRENPSIGIQIYNEGTNPLGPRLVQATLAEAISLRLSESALESLPASPVDATAVKLASHQQPIASSKNQKQNAAEVFEEISAFKTTNHQPKIAMYAAGIAIMFLLFSAGNAGGSLLEEREAGTLDRLLNSQVSLDQLLIGKWLTIALVGFLQLGVMFAWGQIAFSIDVLGHLPGVLLMSAATSAAAASFAIFLATLCKSRQQLHGVSIVLVLTMSAVGGSMVPRYIMSDGMKQLGKLTFNGWAIDGYQKLFWYDLPASAIKLELLVLLTLSVCLGCVARVLSRRWSLAN